MGKMGMMPMMHMARMMPVGVFFMITVLMTLGFIAGFLVGSGQRR